jgi:hypothetical protein
MSARTPAQVAATRQQVRECIERRELPPKHLYDLLEASELYAIACAVAKEMAKS